MLRRAKKLAQLKVSGQNHQTQDVLMQMCKLVSRDLLAQVLKLAKPQVSLRKTC